MNKAPREKAKPLISIEITIGKHKNAIISIREGEQVKEIARNFCKAYGLDKDMYSSLVIQLKGHLTEYYKKQREQGLYDVVQNQLSGVSTTFEHLEVADECLIQNQSSLKEAKNKPISGK